MIKKSFASITLFLLASNALGMEQIVRPYQSTRAAGMGNVRITTGLYDENFFGNPARATANPSRKLQLFDLMLETTSTTIGTAQDLAGGGGDTLAKVADATGKNMHGRIQTTFPALYIPGSKISLAFALMTSTQFDIAMRKNYNLNPQVITDVGPAVTIAKKFLEDENLAIGVTPHLTYRLATQQNYSFVNLFRGDSLSPLKSGADGTHFEFDVGSTYRIPALNGFTITAGASINNILGGNYLNFPFDMLNTPHQPPRQPRAFNVGTSLEQDSFMVFKKSVMAFEVTDIGNNRYGSIFRLIHIGGETHIFNFALRAGINQGYLCAGAGVNLYLVELEAATYGEEMSLNAGGLEDRRYVLRLAVQL